MKSRLTLPAALLLVGIALAPSASAATAQRAAQPAFGHSATSQTVRIQAALPWGRYTSIPPDFVNGSYRPDYGLFRGGN